MPIDTDFHHFVIESREFYLDDLSRESSALRRTALADWIPTFSRVMGLNCTGPGGRRKGQEGSTVGFNSPERGGGIPDTRTVTRTGLVKRQSFNPDDVPHHGGGTHPEELESDQSRESSALRRTALADWIPTFSRVMGLNCTGPGGRRKGQEGSTVGFNSPERGGGIPDTRTVTRTGLVKRQSFNPDDVPHHGGGTHPEELESDQSHRKLFGCSLYWY